MTRNPAKNRPPKQRGKAPKDEIVIVPEVKHPQSQRSKGMDLTYHLLMLGLAAGCIGAAIYFATMDLKTAKTQLFLAAVVLLFGPFIGGAVILLFRNRPHHSTPTVWQIPHAMLQSWLGRLTTALAPIGAVAALLLTGNVWGAVITLSIAWLAYAWAWAKALWAWRNEKPDLPKSKGHRR